MTWPLGWPGRESSCPRANLDLGAGHRPVLDTQRPGGTAYAIGEAGLITALHRWDYTLTDRDPDYVVLGETRGYSLEAITRAIRLIMGGARFIATNPDPTSGDSRLCGVAFAQVAANRPGEVRRSDDRLVNDDPWLTSSGCACSTPRSMR